MSINWVMLDPQKNFVPLPNERILYNSPPRTTFSLTTPNTYPGRTPLSIQSSAGSAFITTQRLIYLPSSPANTTGSPGISSSNLQSFAAPLLNLQDTHVTAPFIGPNAWIAIVKPVSGGGIPATHAYVELKLVFKDGGAFDFHTTFERVREQVLHAVDIAREVGADERLAMTGGGVGEELPAYEGPAATAQSEIPREGHLADVNIPPPPGPPPTRVDRQQDLGAPPNEDPPGYEDVQRGGVANSLEERLRSQNS